MEARNLTSFSGCREYNTESTISFGDIPKMADAQRNKPKPLPPNVPAGIEIESKLETQLDSVLVARGDPFWISQLGRPSWCRLEQRRR